jgi:hypothetical protein
MRLRQCRQIDATRYPILQPANTARQWLQCSLRLYQQEIENVKFGGEGRQEPEDDHKSE